jgi:Mce-associated membrane protein
MPERTSSKPAAPRKPAATARATRKRTAVQPEMVAEPEPSRVSSLRLSRSGWAILGGTIGIIALAVVLVITYLRLSDANSLDQARSEALAAAQTYAVDVASYDYRTLDQNFALVTSHSTGEFKQQFTKASGAIKPLIVQYKGTAKATVLSAGVVKASTESVTVVMFVDQTVTNSNAATPRVDRNRVSMTVSRHGGQWLIEKVELL